jgi:hypothetical protein
MTGIDPDATHLVEEFRARPFGPHSPALQRVLNRMRGLPIAGKHFLIADPASGRYGLAQLGGRGQPVIRHAAPVFETIEAAEWFVFRERWRLLTGQSLPDPDAAPAPPS